MMKTPSPAKFYSDYTKLPSKEPSPKNSFFVNWETLFVDKEKDFVNPTSMQTFSKEDIPMTTYDSHTEKPAEVILTKDASTNTYTVLMGEGSDSDSDDGDEKLLAKKHRPHPLWESEEEEEKPKMNGWIQFYLGSLSVVGLFIFFRMMRKSK